MIDEAQLRSLLAEPRLPMVDRAYRNPGFRHVLAWRLLAMAEARYGNKPELEAELDAAVEAAGGDRSRTIDPWRWIPDLVRQARGAPQPPREDVYAIPERFFEGESN
jgi:hypothetical protein